MITPNYQSGYGPSGGLGSNQTVAVGSGASLDGGFVDFGNVVAGYQYLYKYAAQVAVNTNDSSGFTVYAEGSTNFNAATTGVTAIPIGTTLFWMVSSTSNTSTSAATPFEDTTATVGGTPVGTAITYAGSPPASAVVWSSASGGNVTRGYDYELQLPGSAGTSEFSAYIVYTAIAN